MHCNCRAPLADLQLFGYLKTRVEHVDDDRGSSGRVTHLAHQLRGVHVHHLTEALLLLLLPQLFQKQPRLPILLKCSLLLLLLQLLRLHFPPHHSIFEHGSVSLVDWLQQLHYTTRKR